MRAISFQRSVELFEACGEGAAGECLKVEQAGVPPPVRLADLNLEQLPHVIEASGVDGAFQAEPAAMERVGVLHAA